MLRVPHAGGVGSDCCGDRAAQGKRSPHGKTSPSRSSGLGMEEHPGGTFGQQGAETKLRLFLYFGTCTEVHNYPTLPYLEGALRYSGG
jgi:hypothetical protein